MIADARATAIRQEMAQIREGLGEEVREIVQNAQTLADWRYYVRRYPWVCVGLAVAAGYLVVPRRPEMVTADAETLAQLAKRHKLVVKSQTRADASGGLSGALISAMAKALMRAGISYLGEQGLKVFDSQPHGRSQAPKRAADVSSSQERGP